MWPAVGVAAILEQAQVNIVGAAGRNAAREHDHLGSGRRRPEVEAQGVDLIRRHRPARFHDLGLDAIVLDQHHGGARAGGDLDWKDVDALGGRLAQQEVTGDAAKKAQQLDGFAQGAQHAGDIEGLAAGRRHHLDRLLMATATEARKTQIFIDGGVERNGEDHEGAACGAATTYNSRVAATTEQVLEALHGVRDPVRKGDLVSLSMVHDLAVREGKVWMSVRMDTPDAARQQQLERDIRAALAPLGVQTVEVRFDGTGGAGAAPGATAAAAGVGSVKHIVAVGSGKGGVGKTTVAVNLAVALAEMGSVVGLLDADVYGPNVPLMMGINEMPRVIAENRIEPLRRYGVRLMSMGFLSPGDKPIIWRGPMLHSAMQQFLRQVEWGALDYLLIDLPPGTGDISLSLAQSAPLSGAVVVTTPSDVSLEDARKALHMFHQLKIPVLGVVENMSYFSCPHCHQAVDIFSHGGGESTAERFGVPFLGALPLLPEVRRGGDQGRPVAAEGAESELARPFYALARQCAAQIQARQQAAPPSDVLHVRA